MDGRLTERLREIAGPEHVYSQRDQLRTYESDGLLQYAVTPGVVVLPGTADEVRRAVRVCYEAEVPWVARGSGSGLSGGALPVDATSTWQRCGRRPTSSTSTSATSR